MPDTMDFCPFLHLIRLKTCRRLPEIANLGLIWVELWPEYDIFRLTFVFAVGAYELRLYAVRLISSDLMPIIHHGSIPNVVARRRVGSWLSVVCH